MKTIMVKGPRCECPAEARSKISDDVQTVAQEMDLPVQVIQDMNDAIQSRNHPPGQCPRTHGLQQYRRKGQVLWLCECCTLPGDVEVETQTLPVSFSP